MNDSDSAEGLSLDEIESIEGMARALTRSGMYRVVRRFRPRPRYAEDDGAATRLALFVDVETTGLDHTRDAVIEFCAVPFRYCIATGRIYELGQPLCYLEDPGMPIPGEVTDLTGITDADVKGQRIDDESVAELLATASLVVAHNARFDRPFVEQRLPVFVDKPWACSLKQVPWETTYGLRSSKLEWLLFKSCVEFFDGHRAAQDCYAAIHVLAMPYKGRIPFGELLHAARKPTIRIWARNTPREQNDLLRSRRYRWFPGTSDRRCGWYLDCTPEDAEAEHRWLVQQMFGGRDVPCDREKIDAYRRYSARE